MIFDAMQVTFLQRLVADRPASRRSEMAAYFAREYSVGRLAGRSIAYGENDWLLAAKLLENRGLPIERGDGELRRADTAQYVGLSEKSFGARPHAASVAVRTAFGRCPLDGIPTEVPDGAYLVLRPEDALRVECEQILVVENLETFRYLSRYRWIDYRWKATLAIYRGDTTFNSADAAQIIAKRKEPVMAFTDFDPAGLAIADRLPRLSRLVLPTENWLRDETIKAKRGDLFLNQIDQYAGRLSASSHPDLQRAYRLLVELKRGFNQEWMEAAPSM
ncbi:hypothetical protein LMG23992_04135 [Cupriavidus laharis]|uniref:DUF7281 domain-containing protein n=1 Tax=Cupriavidus laharis TaxID=151654 RepID=A0ABM8XIH5_9BURK|nr:hypothetical protein [Cupriavidus laharis]CAG9179991.1 hypothetical protein LMG23992_04135 [Cupriavidus laharis]